MFEEKEWLVLIPWSFLLLTLWHCKGSDNEKRNKTKPFNQVYPMKHGGSWYRSSWQVYKWLHWVWCRVVCNHRDECEEWKKWKKKGFSIGKAG